MASATLTVSDVFSAFATMHRLEREADRHAQELFGDGDGSDMRPEELDIVFSQMSHKEKVATLKKLKAKRAKVVLVMPRR